MFVRYSPVCDSDPELYKNYLAVAQKCVENGWQFGFSSSEVGVGGCGSEMVDDYKRYLGFVGNLGSRQVCAVEVDVDDRVVESEVPLVESSVECVGNGTSGGSSPGLVVEGVASSEKGDALRIDGSVGGHRGPNYERNQIWKKQKKELKAARKLNGYNSSNWRARGVKSVVDEGKSLSVSRQSLEELWTVENKVKTLKLQEELKRLEARAVDPRPLKFIERKPKTQEEFDLEAAERVKRLKQRIEKHDADIAYWKKRQDSGAIEKAIALENEILDGQLSGKYDPFASRRMLGWAKTVKTHGSGTGSGSGSSGSLDKTVWSGSGATTKTDLSVLEQKVAVYEEKLKKSEKDVVELGKKADALNKQLITVTVESERKDKELFEVKKFKEYLEKAKKEKKRRADNEFETFRTQADCSY